MWNMDVGGAERAVYQLIQAQFKSGIDCSILISNKKGYYGKLLEQSGIPVYFLDMKSGYDLKIRNTFIDIIGNFDAIHFHSAEPYLMYLAKKDNRRKLYYTHRGGKTKYSFKKRFRYYITGKIVKKYFTKVSGNTNAGRVAVSELFDIPVEHIETTYNGIDFSLLKPVKDPDSVKSCFNFNEDDIVIGTSANIRDWKRIHYILETIYAINNPRIKAIIIGEGPEKRNLESLSIKLGLSEQIVFTGKVFNVADFLQIMDVFILPSNSLESFGNSAVEAISLGLPTVVMEDGGGLIEHIIDGKTGFIAKDKDDLISIVRKLCLDKELRRKIGKAGKDYVRNKYSTEKMLESYNNFYNKK